MEKFRFLCNCGNFEVFFVSSILDFWFKNCPIYFSDTDSSVSSSSFDSSSSTLYYTILKDIRDVIKPFSSKTKKILTSSTTPTIVKTTTKQSVVKDQEGVTQNIEEKVEDLTPGGTGQVTVSTQINKVMKLLKLSMILRYIK